MGYGRDILTRFVEKIVVDPTTGCHNWIAGCFADGYGAFNIGGVIWRAPRAAWYLLVDDIPEGMHVLHKCDNVKCVNVDHLFLGTHQDNVEDMVNKNRQSKGDINGHAKLNWREVREIRSKYSSGNYLQKDLAYLYGVCRGTISEVINDKKWKE